MEKEYATKQEVKEIVIEIVKESTSEIIEAIGVFSDRMTERADKVGIRLDKIDGRLDKIERDMVTKDYLDGKLAVVQASMVTAVKGGDSKVNELIKCLVFRNVIPEEEGARLMDLAPFPR